MITTAKTTGTVVVIVVVIFYSIMIVVVVVVVVVVVNTHLSNNSDKIPLRAKTIRLPVNRKNNSNRHTKNRNKIAITMKRDLQYCYWY